MSSVRLFRFMLACGISLAVTTGAARSDGLAPVKIGVLTDMSGMYRDIMGPGSVLAAQMAVDDFGGKVLDRPIEIVSADHKASPDIGSSIARNWFDTQDVGVIVDIAQSAVALAVQDVAAARHKIVMHGVTGSPAITEEACMPTGFSWSLNAHAITAPLPSTLIKQGLDSFFLISADYSFGHSMEKETTKAIRAAGGKITGSIFFPQHNADFGSQILAATSSQAKVVWFNTAAGDTTTALKQAKEFGVADNGQHIVVPLTYITNVHALGLATTQGMIFTTPFYWNRTPEARAFATRFFKQRSSMPTMDHAAVYSATLHYLQAVKQAGTTDGLKVADAIRALPIHDFYVPDGRVRPDGWLMHDFYLVQVKKPEEVKEPWDYYRILATIPANISAQPLSESTCPLINKRAGN